MTADIPRGSHIELWARTGDTMEELDDCPRTGPFVGEEPDHLVNFTADPGPLESSTYLQIEIRLRNDEGLSPPRLYDLDVANVSVPDPV